MRQWANGQYDKDLDGSLRKELRDKQDISRIRKDAADEIQGNVWR